MCRLLGWVAPAGTTLCGAIGEDNLPAFTELSRLHADGWGIAYDDGGEIGVRRSVGSAFADPAFAQIAGDLVTPAALAHLRWATPGLAVQPSNTHPFLVEQMAFAHNGGIYPLDRLDELLEPGGHRQMGGTTDSEYYFLAVMSEFYDRGADMVTALQRVVRRLATDFTPSSLNAMLLTPDALYVVSCANPDFRPRLPQPHREGGHEDYFDLRYRRTEAGVVVASSGFPQPAADGWLPVADNSILVLDRRTAAVSGFPLGVRLRGGDNTARTR